MARQVSRIVDDIRALRPVGDDWRALDNLLAELWATGEAGRFIPDLLGVLERFPEDDGGGVLWSIVHGLEALPGYEPELVQSLRRQPSDLGVTMAGRLLNSGVAEVAGVPLVELLRSVADQGSVLESIRSQAARWVATHGARPPT